MKPLFFIGHNSRFKASKNFMWQSKSHLLFLVVQFFPLLLTGGWHNFFMVFNVRVFFSGFIMHPKYPKGIVALRANFVGYCES